MYRITFNRKVIFPFELLSLDATSPDGAFHHVPRFHDDVIRETFAHEVFSLLLRKKLIGLPLAQKILRWRHTGLSIRSSPISS